jgi:glutamine cyclotransferase
MRFPALKPAALAALLSLAPGLAFAAIPIADVRVVRTYPHDPHAFTEGLFYLDGFLYESTGLTGHSSIRKVRLATGEVVQRLDQPAHDFGEGVVAWKGRLVQLTWQSGVGYVYDLASFAFQSTFRYPGEGWALTHDGHRLIMSDGTPTIRFLDPDTLQETGRIAVTADGRPVDNLNELEWVRGEIYANIWQTNRIARIDPASGRVIGWIDLSRLAAKVHVSDSDAVLNGIAYDAAHDRLFVTGKLWPHLYEIRLVPALPHR